MKYGCSMRMAGRSFTMRKECQVCGGLALSMEGASFAACHIEMMRFYIT